MASNKVTKITSDNFDSEVMKADQPVLVDFWAEWCAPCKLVAPVMDELAEEFEGRAKIANVNIEDEGGLARKFRIMSIPTIMLFKNGQIAEKVIGARPKEELSNIIENNL